MPMMGALLFLCSFAAICGLVATWWIARRWAHLFARCGKCGYVVHGLERMYCPECGADFRKCGILKPINLTRKEFVLLWTVLLPAAAFAPSIIFPLFAPMTHSTWVRLTLLSDHIPRRSYQLDFRCDGQLYGAGAPTPVSGPTPGGQTKTVTWQPAPPAEGVSTIDVRMQDIVLNPNGFGLWVDPIARSYIYDTGSGSVQGHGDVDAQVIEQWLLACGVPAGPDLTEECIDLDAAIRAVTEGKPTFSVSWISPLRQDSGFYISGTRMRWVIVIPFWLVIYALGYLWYIRYRRWRERELKAAQIGQASQESSA